MKWIAAAGAAALIGSFGAAQGQPLEPAPAEVNCASMASGDLRSGRPIRCDVVLDLGGEAASPPASEPQIVTVPAKVVVPRRTVIDAPEPRRTLGVWSGQAMLTSQPASAAAPCAQVAPAGEDVWFPARRGKAAPAQPLPA